MTFVVIRDTEVDIDELVSAADNRVDVVSPMQGRPVQPSGFRISCLTVDAAALAAHAIVPSYYLKQSRKEFVSESSHQSGITI